MSVELKPDRRSCPGTVPAVIAAAQLGRRAHDDGFLLQGVLRAGLCTTHKDQVNADLFPIFTA
jgi:hypothetical protein